MTPFCPDCNTELEEYDTVQNFRSRTVGTIWLCPHCDAFWHDSHGPLYRWYY